MYDEVEKINWTYLILVSTMWKNVQEEQHPVHPSADPQRYEALPMQLLWQEIPSEI